MYISATVYQSFLASPIIFSLGLYKWHVVVVVITKGKPTVLLKMSSDMECIGGVVCLPFIVLFAGFCEKDG